MSEYTIEEVNAKIARLNTELNEMNVIRTKLLSEQYESQQLLLEFENEN